MRRLTVLRFFIGIVEAIPQVNFPFNAQVPGTARFEQPYFFDLSPSTFGSVTGTLAYSISGQPAWLQINSRNGTLYGYPAAGDVGAPQFAIIGTDGTGSASMPATLVVSDSPGPQLTGDLSSAFNDGWMRCGLACIQYGPNTSFSLQMPPSAFTTSGSTYYYATLDDHTPLPGWSKYR
jgi:axial budding pattern protein 2